MFVIGFLVKEEEREGESGKGDFPCRPIKYYIKVVSLF